LVVETLICIPTEDGMGTSEDELKDMNAEYQPVTTGTKAEMHELEEFFLQEYLDSYGVYPPENYNGH